MKILHTVESYYPDKGGMQEVVKRLSEELVAMGHDVTVATRKIPNRTSNIVNGVKIVDFNISGNLTHGIKGDIAPYQKFLVESDFDVIVNFAAQQWASDLTFKVLDKIKAKKVFVPTGFSGLYQKEYEDYFYKMKSWLTKYDMNVFLSNDYRDINYARENEIKNITIIPNGASEKEFDKQDSSKIRKKLKIPNNSYIILNVGSHTGLKGHLETIKIFKKAKNIKNATLIIVGNKGGEYGCDNLCKKLASKFNLSPKRLWDKKSIKLLDLPRDQTVALFKESDIFLFPSNIECSPIVLFEAMASKTPFLVTDVGNSKEIVEWSNGAGVILPTIYEESSYRLSRVEIDKSISILEELYLNNDKRLKMAKNGYNIWKEKYTWEKIAKQYSDLYMSLAGVK